MEELPQLLINTGSSFALGQNCISQSQTRSQLGSRQPSDLFQSKHMDDLLETSYVQLDKMNQKKEHASHPCCNSGTTFFNKTSNLFYSDIGKTDKKRMKHKKLQCDIGSGNSSISVQIPSTVKGREQRLEILKMIKLLRLVFRQLKSERATMKENVIKQESKFKKFIVQMSDKWETELRECQEKLRQKDFKLAQLSKQFEQVLNENQTLRNTLDLRAIQSSSKIKGLEEDTWKSFKEIEDEVEDSKTKILTLNDKILSLESDSMDFNEQVSHLTQIINAKEIDLKKLEYHNRVLDSENNEMGQRIEELLQRCLEMEGKYSEECVETEQKNHKYNEMIRLNDLYMKEIDSCKEQIRQLSEQKESLKLESENFVIHELNKYQQYFNEEYMKIKKDHNKELFDKNYVIDNLNFKEKVYMSVIAEKHQMQSNSTRQTTKDSSPVNDHKSEGYIVSRDNVSCSSYRTHKVDQRSQSGDFLSFQRKGLVNKENKNLLFGLNFNQNRPLNFTQRKEQTHQLIFRAPTHHKNDIRLNDHLQSDQNEISFSASDGLNRFSFQNKSKPNYCPIGGRHITFDVASNNEK